MTEERDFERAMQNLSRSLSEAVDVQSDTAEAIHIALLKHNGSLTTGVATGVLISLAYSLRQVALRLGDEAPATLAAEASIMILRQLKENLGKYTVGQVLNTMMQSDHLQDDIANLEPQGHA